TAAHSDRGLSHTGQRGNQFLVHMSGQYHHGVIPRLGVRDAQAINEFAGLAHLAEDARQRGSAAMDHGDLMFARQLLYRECGAMQKISVFQRCASKFDDDLHFRPSCSFHPNIRFMFCTAWPAAPFSRLSRQETITMRRWSAASVKPISQ